MKVWNKWSIKPWAQVLIIGFLCMISTSMAAAANEKSDAGNKTDYAQAGDLLIWLEQMDSGLKKLIVQNQSTGQQIQVTDGSTAVDAPSTNGEWVVWADKGNEPLSSLNWEIHGYHVPSGKKQKLSNEAGIYGNPTVDQYGVVWYKRSTYGEMIYRDLQSGLEFSLGEGRFPILVDRKLVYKNARDGGLSMLDLSSGVKRNLVTLGSTYYVDWFVFNGTHVLAREHDGTGNSQYIAMNATAPTLQVTELSEPSSEAGMYDAMFISQEFAVYMQLENGKPTLHSIQLDTMTKSQSMAVPINTNVIGINGTKLLLAHADGTLSQISLVKDTGGSSPNTNVPAEELITANTYIDEKGGTLNVGDGLASITFIQDAFSKRTKVSLSQKKLTETAYDEAGRVLDFASSIWNLEMESLPTKAASLSITIGDDSKWDKVIEKLAIYRWNEELRHWSYIGGVNQGANKSIQASISGQGQYAVMLRSVTFADISGHWSQAAVEILASRGIVDGISATRYAPQQTLTRAEFTKLLASAIGLKQLEGSTSTFSDVLPTDWYYGWVEAAALAGIIQGDNGLFKPQDALTREEMMTMLIRATGDQLSTEVQLDVSEVLAKFDDEATISSWAKPHAALAVHLGLIEGANGHLDPRGLSNRAQAAMVIYRLSKALNTI
ncbi:MAG: S-layer homology domain-containing protein [Candidatus Pristimantibacillus lignocellulolyticus]|uniref:S-layer homology domain-containing protein n=1 Tax=Candidatus Pristimantibacillus lignocellulolyticus TaxID=2994561 RepID=A0A9J6ZBK8_9BACL|nr:MAG: S-layer homology domain-containing protein [Candidatus Pristimantibacillus lignocellulolyticus]